MKRKTFVAAALFTACATAVLPACASLYGNDRSVTTFLLPAEDEDGYYYKLDENRFLAEYLCLSKQTGEYSIVKTELNGESAGDTPNGAGESEKSEAEYWETDEGEYFEIPPEPVVLDGSTFPRASARLSPDCAPLLDILTDTYIGSAQYLSYFAAADSDGTVYGFCNAFYNATGYLSGGGNCGVEEIAFSVLFTYDIETETFDETARYEGCNVVACSATSALYFRDNQYFICKDGEEFYICDDQAFDTGVTHYSHAQFYFNDKTAVLRFANRQSNESKDYNVTVVCDFDGNVLFERRDDETLSKMADRYIKTEEE